MKTQTPCPETGELERLVDGSLSGQRQQECSAHLDACGCCQERLESIATGGSNLSQVIRRMTDSQPPAESACWRVLHALDGEAQQAVATPPPQQTVAFPTPGPSPVVIPPVVSPQPAVRPAAEGPGEPRSAVREVALTFLEPASDSAYLGRLAHFDVMRVLGRGGMGVVLEAFDSRLQRNVAIKVLDPELAGDEVARQRFCREARAAASITHENVVAVHQVEKSGEAKLPYMVMQLIAGETLEQRLARLKKLPVREVVRIGMQAAHGLAAAHDQGLIHRDIKPGNILLEPPNDRVKLTDFGLARVVEDVKLTATGFVTGTPLYMAPEQALGEPADQRFDLFSLGAVLYEMCAGQPPFGGNSALVILKQIVDADPRPLRDLNPEVPEWFARTIERLLAKKPADRIQSAAQLAELLDFEWALMKTTSPDVPTICELEERKQTRRNRLIAAGVGAVFLALGLIGGMLLSGGGPTKIATDAEPVAILSAKAGAVWSVAFDPSSTTLAMATEDGTVRLWDWPTQSIKSTINAHRGVVWRARFNRNGELLATSGDDGRINIWNAGQGELQHSFKHPNAVRGLAFAHDDQTLYAGDRDGRLRIWRMDATEPLAETETPSGLYAVAISPNDETLAAAGNDKTVRLWNAKNLAPKLSLDGHSGPVYGLSFSGDGRRLASVGWDGTVPRLGRRRRNAREILECRWA